MVDDDTEEIEKVRKGEDINYSESRKYLGDTISLIQDLIGLYHLIIEIVKRAKIEMNNKNILIFNFILSCRYYLTISALACLRGHLIDSLNSTRCAVEITGFAYRIENHPHLAQVWLDAGDDEDSYNNYRGEFKVGKLFPKSHKLLYDLYQRYNLFSRTTHPSLYQFAGRMIIDRKEDKMSIGMNYCELKNDNPSEPIRTFLSIADIHLKIIQIFEEIFKNEIRVDQSRWDINKNSVEAKMEYHKHKWKKSIQSIR